MITLIRRFSTRHLFLVAILIASVIVASPLRPTQAAEDEQSAVALAAAHPVFVGLLAQHEGWHGAAYNTRTKLAVWRVQFWTQDWTELGSADVSLKQGKVYDWRLTDDAGEDRKRQALETITKLVKSAPETRDLIKQLGDFESYGGYNGDLDIWGFTFYKGTDAIEVLVRFGDAARFRNPQIISVRFPWLASYGEWYNSQQASAISLASTSTDVAKMLTEKSGWTAKADSNGQGQWIVEFKSGDQVFMTVTVDLVAGTIVGVAAS